MGTILAVTGLNREAAIASGPGVLAIAGGASSGALAARLEALDSSDVDAVVSFGIAGALDPGLAVGDVLIAHTVSAGEDAFTCAGAASAAWEPRLRGVSGLRAASIAGVDAPLLRASDKAELRAKSGAHAVDMESHVAAAYARSRGLPFAALRVISDRAESELPAVAGNAMRPDGSVAIGQVLMGLVRDPGQLVPLLGTARDAAIAFRVLGRVRRLLGPRLGFDL
jgi:hopanoid-associated phosphorylase